LRLFFYEIVVRFYRFYLYATKKLGWHFFEGSSALRFFKQKTIHFAVISLTMVLVFTNFIGKTKADFSSADMANGTILSDLIKSEFGSLEEEKLIEEFFDEEAVISPVQQNYLDNLAAVRPDNGAQLDFGDEQGAAGNGVLVKPEIVSTQKIKRTRTETIKYTVQPGDSISTIASDFSISVSTILWENNLSAYSIIRPGDELSILPVSGITHKVASGENLSAIAKKYDIAEGEIMEANKIDDSSRLAIGQALLIPGGSKTSYAKSTAKKYSGISAIKDLVKSPSAAPIAGNKMNWPTNGHRITQYYSWKHHGLDVANKVGTPIYAADAGTIEYAGWGTGYGNQIVVDHGGGKKTRYAHLSKFYVEKGQEVDKGEAIAAMGSTGWSTGPHLHFEVIINGAKYNPLNYIK
jgi:murein DD-endopeptidase MepM/ murein hydrolase activator NlpD